MVIDEMRVRFERGLRDVQPHTALRGLALALKGEGVSQVAVYRLFSEFQVKTDGNDPRYDAIVDNMDLVWGGAWAKGGALFDTELSESDVVPSDVDGDAPPPSCG